MNLSFEKKRFFIVFCAIQLLWVLMFWDKKTQGRKILIFYKIKIRTLAMNKHCKVEHLIVSKCMLMRLYNNVLLTHMLLRNKVSRFKKW